MRRIKLIIAAFLLISPLVANADLIRVEATSLAPASYSDFTVVFDDTGDGLLQWDEILSFSGVVWFGVFMDYLSSTPDLAGISTFSTDPTLSPGLMAFCEAEPLGWCIAQGSGVDVRAFTSNWSYVVTSVPEPGTLALLGIGLAGMGLARRRKTV